MIYEGVLVVLGQSPFRCEKPRKLLQLRTTECRIEVGHAVIEADFVVNVVPAMWNFSGSRKVLGSVRERRIIREECPPASGSYRLVAVEAEDAEFPEGSGVTFLVVTSQRFCCILD